ncbi:unnamed protein product [Pylaiella littoralis]
MMWGMYFLFFFTFICISVVPTSSSVRHGGAKPSEIRVAAAANLLFVNVNPQLRPRLRKEHTFEATVGEGGVSAVISGTVFCFNAFAHTATSVPAVVCRAKRGCRD